MAETKKKQLPRFTAFQRQFIKNLLLDGYENPEILRKFKEKYFPANGYCDNPVDLQKFRVRVTKLRMMLNKNDVVKKLTKQAKYGLARKDARILFIKKQISISLDLATEIHARLSQDIENKDLNYLFDKHQKRIFAELKHLAIELNEYKTTAFNVNIDSRDQRKMIYAGQAVLPELDREKMKELQIVEVPAEDAKALPGADDNPGKETKK